MISFKKLSLYYKIISVFFSMLILLSILVGLLMRNSLDTMLSQQFEKRGVEITARLASLSANHILVNDLFSLYEIANEIKTGSDDVRYVLITDHRGSILAHTFSGGIPEGLMNINKTDGFEDTFDENYMFEYINTNEGLVLDILTPIENGKIGFARVGMSEEYMKKEITQKIKNVILITFAVCIFAALLTAKLTAIITKPIRELVEASQEIAGGNLVKRLKVRSNDELGKLAKDFNNMADSLVKHNDIKDKLLKELKEKEKRRKALVNKLFTVQEDERKRISRELHDETSQMLTSLIVTMRMLVNDEMDEDQKKIFLEIRESIVEVLKNVRNLAVELRPPVLDDLGLVAAIKKYILNYQKHYNMWVQFDSNISGISINSEISLALYRIMQEGLTNVAKHSNADTVKLNLYNTGKNIHLSISDNGKGFSKKALLDARKKDRIGIYGMQERAELLGGSFKIISSSFGTTINVTITNSAN